jgi:hypothetical protein
MQADRLPRLLALIFLSTAACGSSDTSGNAGNGAGDGGASGGSDGGGTTTPSTPYYGSVTFLRGFEFNASTLQLNADLFVTPASGIPGLCPAGSSQSGSCCLRSPDREIIGDVPANAGTLTLMDNSTPNNPTLGTATFVISQAPGVPNGYSLSGPTDTFDWSAGDKLAVSAAGDAAGVAAFAGSVIAPVDLAGVSPSPGAISSPLSISTQSDSVLTWSAGSSPGSQVEVEIDADNNASTGSLLCMTSDSSGQITVPSALTHNIPAGSTGTITVTRVGVGTLSTPASNATIRVLATSLPVSGYMIYQ